MGIRGQKRVEITGENGGLWGENSKGLKGGEIGRENDQERCGKAHFSP